MISSIMLLLSGKTAEMSGVDLVKIFKNREVSHEEDFEMRV